MKTKPKLAKCVAKYLKSCWGYNNVSEIDRLTLDCIRENAAAGYKWDQQIMRAWRESRKL